MIRVEHADMLTAIPRLVAEGVVVDAVCCDPPYHLVSNAKRWAPGRSASCDVEDGRYRRLSGGFMGQQWDGGDIAFRPETWATVATIMRPGAFLVAFGGTRSSHRMISAIEDAGFVIQDKLMWLFGTGFPKRRDMLKPAYEDICLAYKPGGKRTMQIDECRVGTEALPRLVAGAAQIARENNAGRITPERIGRWPANICHDGSDEVLAAFPESVSSPSRIKHGKGESTPNGNGTFAARDFVTRYDDAGSAARFFFSAKAGAQDRWGSRHPTVKPVDLIAWLVALVCPPGGTFLDPFAGTGTAAVAALKTGRNAILIEREAQYVADIRERVAFYEGRGQHSAQAKHRNRKVEVGPLFDRPYNPVADAIGSYYEAIREIGRRVKAGEEPAT